MKKELAVQQSLPNKKQYCLSSCYENSTEKVDCYTDGPLNFGKREAEEAHGGNVIRERHKR